MPAGGVFSGSGIASPRVLQSKHEESLARTTKRVLRQMRPRQRKHPNIYDVAQRARVSVFTVSQVINKTGQVSSALERRVQAAIRALDYRPSLVARSLAKQKTHTIGMVVPDISNPFFPLIVRGAEDAAQEAGYSILLCNSDDTPEKEELYLEILLAKRVDGILLTKTPSRFTTSFQRTLHSARVPVVLVMRAYPELNADTVVTDDVKGAYELVTHFIRVGHRSVGTVTGPLNVSSGKDRLLGLRKALKEHGLRFDPGLVFEGDYRVDSGYRAGLALLPKRPDVVLIANYLMTVGFVNAANEMGLRCPQEIALATFDDYPWLGSFEPRLTTVELPKYELGKAAVGLVLDRIAGTRKRPTTIRLAPVLRVRDSCGFRLATKQRNAAEVGASTAD